MEISRQIDLIKTLGEYTYESYQTHVTDTMFDQLAAQWEQKNIEPLEQFVGKEGRISFPFELNNALLESDRSIVYELRQINWNLRELFNPWDIRRLDSYDDAKDEFKDLLSKWDDSVLAFEFRTQKNRIVLKSVKSTMKDIHNNSFDVATRGSSRKTLDKLMRDVFKEQYTYYKELVNPQLGQLLERLSDLEQSISRSVQKKGTLYLSALPEDILTASENTYGWESCFSTGGEWAIAPYNYLRNHNTMILYFVSDDSKAKTFEIGDYEVHNKEWRMFIYVTAKGNLAFSSAQYPFNSIEVRDEIGQLLAEKFCGEYDSNFDNVERDGYTHFDGAEGYIKLLSENGVAKEITRDFITDDETVCLESGYYIGEDVEEVRSFVSAEYLDVAYCEDCGEYVHTDELTSVHFSYGEENFCEGCLESRMGDGEIYLCEFDQELYDRDHYEPVIIVSEHGIDFYNSDNMSLDDILGLEAITFYATRRHYIDGEYKAAVIPIPVFLEEGGREYLEKSDWGVNRIVGYNPMYVDLDTEKREYKSYEDLMKAISDE